MSYKEKIFLLVSLALYGIVGLLYIAKQGFWHDEIHTLTFLRGISAYDFEHSSLSEFHGVISSYFCKGLYHQDNFMTDFYNRIIEEGHPPLYFLLLKGWAVFMGHSELALRSFSLLCGSVSMLILYLHFRTSNNKTISGSILLLLLFNPTLFYYFAEARMYATSFLFASLTFIYWSKYKVFYKTSNFCLFCLFSVMLLYTHYYGVFFILLLIFFDVFQTGFHKRILKYIIPFLFFLPWSIVILKQNKVHIIHWTNGSLNLHEAFLGYIKGLINLEFSPMQDHNILEGIIAILLLVFLTIFLKQRIFKYLFGSLYLFLTLFMFDKISDHHTIIISRYYMTFLIILLWMTIQAFLLMPKKYIVLFTSIYCFITFSIILDIYHLKRVPKQMYRELAYYISSNYSPENTLLVIEPKAPAIWGIAYYLPENFHLIAAKDYHSSGVHKRGYKVLFIDENLGDIYHEGKYNSTEQENLKKINFVAISLYE